MIFIGDYQILRCCFGPQGEVDGIERLAGDEWELGGRVGKRTVSVVAQERRLFAEEQQVKIVIVVVIDPDGFGVSGGGKGSRKLGVFAVSFSVESGPGGCEYTKIVAGRGQTGYVLDLFQTAEEKDIVVKLLDAFGIPGEQVRAGGGDSGDVPRQDFAGKAGIGNGGAGAIDAVIDFGIFAGFHVLRDGGAHLAFLDLLESGKLLGGIGGTVGLAVGIVELEMRGGQIRVKPGGDFKFCYGIGGLAIQLEKSCQVVMRLNVVRN